MLILPPPPTPSDQFQNSECSIYWAATESLLAPRWCFHGTNASLAWDEKKYQWQWIVEKTGKNFRFLICWQSFWGRLAHFFGLYGAKYTLFKFSVMLLLLLLLCILSPPLFFIISFFSMNGTHGWSGGGGVLSCLFYPGKTLIFFACEKTFGEIHYLLRMITSFSIHKYTEPRFLRTFFIALLLLVVAVLLNIHSLVWSLSPKFHLFGSFLCQVLDNHSE